MLVFKFLDEVTQSLNARKRHRVVDACAHPPNQAVPLEVEQVVGSGCFDEFLAEAIESGRVDAGELA